MHIPQGGFQSQCGGNALWENLENQNRLISLWKEIAKRYKNEPQIAGYDILNEPIPTVSIQQWTNLAQNIINAIRNEDPNHLIIVERAIALNCNYGYKDQYLNYPQVIENNLMYTAHFYEPYEFTHQLLNWANTGEGGSYPDSTKIVLPSDLNYAAGHYNNPSIITGNSNWTRYIVTPYKIEQDCLIIGRVVFNANRLENGKVYFDDIELLELDENNKYIRTIFSQKLNNNTFWFWSADGTGTPGTSNQGHQNNFSITLTGNKNAATIILNEFYFITTKGRKYVISGWMKGENIPPYARASITTEFYYSPSRQKILTRNREFLRKKIIELIAYPLSQNFPVYIGEFGTSRPSFENNRGGEVWTKDCLDLFDSLGPHFTYHAYKESSFGLYDGWDQPTDTTTVNTKLVNVFKNYFLKTSPFTWKEVKSNLVIFPSPANEKLYIYNPKPNSIQKIEIWDLSQKLVLETNQTEILIENIPKGLYLIKIFTKGNELLIEKFLKN
jgi:endoglucanase